MKTALSLILVAAFGQLLHGDEVAFNREIRPLLSQNCFGCHGPDANQRKADLRLDTEKGIRAAFAGGLKSKAWKRLTSKDPDVQMPPPSAKLKIKPQHLALIGRWAKKGAPWQGHWAYLPVKRPAVRNKGKSKQAIDFFIRRELKQASVKPAVRANRATLLRRLSLDIVGLPPKPKDVDAFVRDRSPNSVEKVVDRLLASSQYGERLAVYWLDLVRYADSVGYHKDSHRECWMYRDYVVDAFNDNVRFDKFVVEQLAGDLLKGNKFQTYRWRIASGFNRMNQTTSEGGAQAGEYLAKYSADRVRNTAAIFLGTTLGCSECHDHKYDPFTAKDFYSFAAFFADLKERGVGYPAATAMPTRSQLTKWKKLEIDLAKLRSSAAKDKAAKRKRIRELEQQLKAIRDTKKWHKTLISTPRKPRQIRLLRRGNWLDRGGPIMTSQTPVSLGVLKVGKRATRLHLARWIANRNNPLTARVFVNRLWKLYFGHGISRTLDDLGSQGEWPTHPELLDWLAAEFMDSGWNIKHIVKTIVMSETYQRSSVATAQQLKRDPENRLLSRQARFRLSAEFVRDNALAISGLLSTKMGGRSVKPYQPANYWYRLYKDAKYNTDRGADQYRRGLYTYWRRSFWHASLRAFDAPAREECVAQRPRSNTPQQSLVLLNDPTYVEAARALAVKVLQHGGSTFDSRLRFAYRRALARVPNTVEARILRQLWTQQKQRYRHDKKNAVQLLSVGDTPAPKSLDVVTLAAWTTVARTILNLHETITRN